MRERFTSNIVETTFGTLVDAKKITKSCASNIQKRGAFFTFSIRLENDDIWEYYFTERTRAEHMRGILISHLEQRITRKIKRSN